VSVEKFVLHDVSDINEADRDLGLTKLELLLMLADELGYGTYGLHKKEGKQKELTIVCYSDGTAIVDINKHQIAYDCPDMQYELTELRDNMYIDIRCRQVKVCETEI